MKNFFALIIILAILSSCAPTQEQIEKAILETQTEEVRLYTSTPADTNTPLPTDTPVATNTPKPTSTRRPTNTPRPTLGTFSNPFPFGAEALMTLTDEGQKVSFNLKVEEIIRGDEAWSIIVRANRFNDPPPDGFEAILVKVYVKNTSSAGFLELKYYDLALATKGNVLDGWFYSPCCLDNAGLVEFEAKLNPSGEHTGWFPAAVHIDEYTPMLVVGADRSGKGGIYFSLY